MKSENINKLLKCLKESEAWISANELGKMINVNKRTIINYVNEINKQGCYFIEGSSKGYKLQKKESVHELSFSNSSCTHSRSRMILYHLLSSKNGISIFDLAEEFSVSESTITSDVNLYLKELLMNYHLEVISKDFVYYLNGSEINKRRLIGFLATHNANGFFSSTAVLQNLSESLNVENIANTLSEICTNSNLSINSYAKNNLLVHLIIILIRLQTNNELNYENEYTAVDLLLENHAQKEQITDFLSKIKDFCFSLTGKSLPKSDLTQISLLLSLSIEQFHAGNIDLDDFSNFIDHHFFNTVIKIILNLKKKYDLPDFSNEFICQLTLHTFNLYQRASYNINYPNPLASKIKKEYAPIYDMAVSFAHSFAKSYNVRISEDEIGFIAFHLGSYLENNRTKADKLPFVLIVENYWLSSKALLHELHYSFGEELTLVDTLTLSEYKRNNIFVDLIISTTDYDFEHPHVVTINPIITKNNIIAIHSEIELIKKEKKFQKITNSIHYLFSKNLFFHNVYKRDREEYIRYLGNYCKQYNLIDDSFIEDVLARENFSNTAFTDYVAIPHSISISSKRSFICVVHNEKPILWDKKNVNFILLMGFAQDETQLFRDVFDVIIESFISTEKTLMLLKTNTFEQFMDVLIHK